MKQTHKQQAQGVIVTGHPRSGTTILNRFLNSHQDIFMTFEFNLFGGLGKTCSQYVNRLRKNWQDRPLIKSENLDSQKPESWLINKQFIEAYLQAIGMGAEQFIEYRQIMTAMEQAAPGYLVMGDKVPQYIFKLKLLLDEKRLKKIVIYRNCSHVARSCIQKSQNEWADKAFGKKYDSAKKVASSWLKAISIMEQHREQLLTVRYEDLLVDPDRQAERLGAFLGVSPGGFCRSIIRKDMSKDHVVHLTLEEETVILDIAGPVMKKLGYL